MCLNISIPFRQHSAIKGKILSGVVSLTKATRIILSVSCGCTFINPTYESCCVFRK